MKPMSADTSESAEQVQLELLRRAPAWRKLEMTFALNRGLKNLILADLIDRHPNDDPITRKRRLAERWLGPDLARQVYGGIGEL